MNDEGPTNGAKLDEPAERDVDSALVSYAEELRAVGQILEPQKFTSVELEVEGNGYRIRAEVDQSEKEDPSLAAILKKVLRSFTPFPRKGMTQTKGPSIELRYGPAEIQKIIQQGITRRLDIHALPDHFSLSHILRQTGAYLDGLDHATLVGVALEDRLITVRYKDSRGQIKELKQDLQFFYDYWVKMYLRRSGRAAPKQSARPTYVTRP